MKQDLLAKGFSLPTLIYRQYFLYRIRRFVSELIYYVSAKTRNTCTSVVAGYTRV